MPSPSSTPTRRRRENYELAIKSFDAETANLDASIAEINDGTMLDKLLKRDESDHYGWFWQLRDLPDAPQSRYLYHLLAGHDFQEGLKNYRDLAFLGGTLAQVAGQHRRLRRHARHARKAYAERVPQADAVLASGRLDKYGNDRATVGRPARPGRSHAGRGGARHAGGARPVGAHPAARGRAARPRPTTTRPT